MRTHEILFVIGIVAVAGLAIRFNSVMMLWQDFLDSLNSDGGHVLLLAVLVIIGMLGIEYAIPKADDLYVGAFTALLILLKSAGSNKTRRDRPAAGPEQPTEKSE